MECCQIGLPLIPYSKDLSWFWIKTLPRLFISDIDPELYKVFLALDLHGSPECSSVAHRSIDRSNIVLSARVSRELEVSSMRGSITISQLVPGTTAGICSYIFLESREHQKSS